MNAAPYLSLPPIAQDALTAQLRALGLAAGDTVFVHCSLSRMGHVPFIDFETRFPVTCRDETGPYTVRIACHSAPLPANFTAIEPALAERGLLRLGRVGQAECRLARAKDILETALAALTENPYFLRIQAPETG